MALKAEGKCPAKTVYRQIKNLNHVVEADHGKLKQLILPVQGFEALKTAYATITGFEGMRALRKGAGGDLELDARDPRRGAHGRTRIRPRRRCARGGRRNDW